MDKITLKRANVVKEVLSEEAARVLERKGFVRDGAVPAGRRNPVDTAALWKQIEEQKEEMAKASKAAEAAEAETKRHAQELAEARKELEEADKKIKALSQELDGTREQLEAALKKNAASARKEKQTGGG